MDIFNIMNHLLLIYWSTFIKMTDMIKTSTQMISMSRCNKQNAASFLHFIPDELSMSIVPSCTHSSAIGKQRTAFLTFIPHDTPLTPYI